MYYTFSKNKNVFFKKSDLPSTNLVITNSEDQELNTYYYIYTKLTNQNFSVSKLKKTQLFYELIELFSHIQFINNFKYINIGDFSNTDCFKQFAEYKITKFNYYLNSFDNKPLLKFDLLFFNLCSDNYLFYIIYLICNYQNKNGYTIIKMNNKNIHFLYLLTSLFTKTIICRPAVMSNNEDYYIICQKFNNTYDYDIGQTVLENVDGITCNIPYHFINYINEIFVMIKHQYVLFKKNEIFLKNLNEEKMENVKNKNIYNCIKWCEDHDIPCNPVKNNVFNDKL